MESNPLYLKSEKKIINLAEQQILKNIAQRVSDSPNCVVKNGIPRTDGVNIFLPFNDKSLNLNLKMSNIFNRFKPCKFFIMNMMSFIINNH